LVPDIVVTGKPMGNGLPLAAAAASRKLVENFRAATGYFNTYASSPLQAAVGMAVLDVIERDQLLANAAATGAFLRQGLRACMQRCAAIGDIRGHGLFLGVEIVSDRQSKTPDRECAVDLVNRLKERGFLTSNAGAFGNVIKVRPPLVFRQEHAEAFLDAFGATLSDLDG
jgi:4-aminobutyrate aminotransferase-like enzyme